jgi:DNA-directed RNA polymerase subunit RPC12/RpoP
MKCDRCKKYFPSLEELNVTLGDYKGKLHVCRSCSRRLLGEEAVQFD